MGRFDVVKVQRKVEGFDLMVHHRDEKTGLVTKSDPYTLRVTGVQGGEKTEIFERPPGSGNCFAKNGEPIGRWVVDPKTKRGSLKEGEPHVTYSKPETQDQKLAKELITKDSRIAELERELAAINAEKEKKSKGS